MEFSMNSDQKDMHNKLITTNKAMMNLKQLVSQLQGAKKSDQELIIIKKKLVRKEEYCKKLE